MNETVQKWLERNRPPRVRITYEVETGGAVEKRELPFVVGLFADLSGDRFGQPTDAQRNRPPDYVERAMQRIDSDSFNDVLAHVRPAVTLQDIPDPVDPKHPPLTADPLYFASLDDFGPLAVVQRVAPLAARYRARGNIRMLQARVETSPALANRLDAMLRAPDDATRKSLAVLAPAGGAPDLKNAQAVLGQIADALKNAKTDDDRQAAVQPFGFEKSPLGVEQARTLVGMFIAPAVDDGTQPDALKDEAQADAARAALLPAGLQEPADLETAAEAQVSPAQAAELRHLADSRRFGYSLLGAAVPPGSKAVNLQQVGPVLELLDAAGLKTDAERQRFLAPLGHFYNEVLAPTSASSQLSTVMAIDRRVAQIDEQLSLQLRAIMHSPSFRALEATWRGLFHVVSRAETGAHLKLYVFNATRQELLDDVERAVDKDQSHLFKMIYEAGYGTLGGEPFSLLVGGYEIGRNPQDIDFLAKVAEVAAASHAPFIAAASPSLFGLDTYADLARPRDLEKIFEGVELVGFQDFRRSEDSRYVTLVLPRVLLRLPYGAKSLPTEGIVFEEMDVPGDGDALLWGNAAWFLAERITNAFSLYSWTAAIRGVEGGGLVQGLPLYTYPIYPNNSEAKQLFCPTEVSVTDRREKELSDLGFIALCHSKGTGNAAFFGGQTTNQPKTYISDSANANARLSALLPYMLAASRFAHYIKVIVRDKIGSFLTRRDVESFLNTWISQYVLLDENATADAKAAFPLSQANVVVTEVPGEPGSYKAVVFLRPHFQLEELTTSIRLVANLPAAA